MSHILTLHLPLDPARGDFSGDVLAERLGDLDVQDVQAFLHEYGGAPALAVVVRHAGDSPSRRKRPTDWRAELAAADVPLFETLRSWRNRTAAEAGLRPYRVVTNRALAGVAALRPRSSGELEAVPGVGPWTLEHYGDALLATVAQAEVPATAERHPRRAEDGQSPASPGPTAERPGAEREGHAAPFGRAERGPR